ncbi:cell cycle progression protein 1 isoform X2 [Pantherophis guttatus]|uniref:Cell cycle progression protein 1 isoform X2 n=1 Tax=Pantherophis guttatus TaxID=94885 RepID=A0A6P9BAW6_PANGU|nr:cell cycle progression protein 1 isoform X2 [Pantherophis guttatus]
MSEISSDSDSSCGWTVINHEGSDVEAAAPDSDSISGHEELASEEFLSPTQAEDQQQQATSLQVDFSQGDGAPVSAISQPPMETSKLVPGDEKEKLLDETSCVGAVSDDSDIVTLEVPKVEEVGNQEEAASGEEEGQASENFNMGSSSSSQYTFCQPETAGWLEQLWMVVLRWVSRWVFPLQPSGEESSSDETSHGSSPALRRRRAKKRLLSSSESEEGLPPRDVKQAKHLLSSGLNRCIILALVIAVSMGFGHFYGTVQIQKRQELVEKTHEDKLNGMKGDLLQCQQEGSKTPCGSLKEGLAKCWLTTQMEKKSFQSQKHHLASENQHLRESLQREEKALALLQEELRKLREQVRHLESKGPGPESLVVTENQKLKAHLEEEKHRMQSFVKQKETLLAEAQMLRRELDKERQVTVALRETLEKLSAEHVPLVAEAGSHKSQEIETLRGMLTELEKKLSFEQQRSDLWEKLYVEVKDHAEKQERAGKAQKPAGKGGNPSKAKPKATFFGSVKETFDAMKNSTKEFVRHHKEKIKQAKEAVKENLRKFSDSVKSTFRHFKDTTKNIFDGREKKRYGDRRHETNRKGRMMHQTDGSRDGPAKPAQHQAPGSQRHFGHRRPRAEDTQPLTPLSTDTASGQCPKGPAGSPKHHIILKGCSGIFDCAHQEFISLFNKVLDPIRADEFNQLMHKYLQQEVKNFHHWRELEIFISNFFCNGVFIHDQMLFSDFVNDVKDYLKDMEEYQRASDRAFEGLDKYIYQYYFHHYNQIPPCGSSPQQERHLPKHQQRSKRESRWQKQGRSNGRHTANLEIEVGRLPFDPKY